MAFPKAEAHGLCGLKEKNKNKNGKGSSDPREKEIGREGFFSYDFSYKNHDLRRSNRPNSNPISVT